MPLLIDPAKPYSKSLSDWIAQYFLVPTLWSSDNDTTHMLNNVVNGAFLVTYGFDGYDLTKNAYYNTESSEIIEYTSLTLDPWLALASFLGLPTRTDVVEEEANEQSQLTDTTQDNSISATVDFFTESAPVAPTKISYPKISLTQFFLKNFIGGWQWSNMSTEKKITQIIGLLIKVPVIFPFKIFTLFLKIPLNILKFFTEFLPLILTTLTIVAVIWLALKVSEYSGTKVKKTHGKKPSEADKKLSDLWKIPAVFLSIITVALTLIYLAIRVFYITGRALTAPLHSMSIAFEYAQELKVPFVSQHTSQRIMFFVGGLFALVSLAFSASLWAFALPLLFGSIVVYLPKIAQLATTVLNWPFMAHLISNLSVVFTAVGGGLNAVFGALLTTSSGLLGFQLSTTFITTGLTLGAIVTPIATFLSLAADKLSDKWFTWHEGGFFTSLLFAPPDSEDTSYTPLIDQTPKQSPVTGNTTSPGAQGIVSSAITSEWTAHDGHMGAVKSQKRAEGQEGLTTSGTAPTKGSGDQNSDNPDYGPDGQLLAEL